MILKSYCNEKGHTVSLQMDLDENYFPIKYKVYCNYALDTFPGTKKGAEKARKYFENYVSMFDRPKTTKKLFLYEISSDSESWTKQWLTVTEAEEQRNAGFIVIQLDPSLHYKEI